MYCNKCGKEIADNVDFCTYCGAKIETVGQPTVQKKVVMKCSKCGKVVESGMKFCTHCGGEVVASEQTVEVENNVRSTASAAASTLNNAGKNFVASISMILIAVLGLIYLVTAIKTFGGNCDAFDWISDGYKTLGIVLHWGICAVFVVDCAQCLFKVLKLGNKGKHIIQTSISLLITTFLLWIGSLIWNDFEFEDISIVLYRIFGTYGQITAISFVLLIICLICGVLCVKAEQD